VTYRYYAVDDGVETHVHAMVVRSEWTATGRPPRRPTSTSNWPPASASCSTGSGPGPSPSTSVATREAFYAVDVDPAPDFFGTDLDRRLRGLVRFLATIGA